MKLKFYILMLLVFSASYSQQENSEFADYITEAYYSYSNKDHKSFYGGREGYYINGIDPNVILGNNITYFLSLPTDSYIVAEFIDNKIIDYPNQDDISIAETGCSGDRAEVYVSADGVNFIKLGEVDDCHKSTLDLKDINFLSAVRFIKVVGLDNKGASPGFDLVNIMGLPNSSIQIDLTATSINKDSKETLEPLDKKIILKTIHFDSNSVELSEESKELLNVMSSQLKDQPHVKIKVIGYTDDVGNDVANLDLSLRRSQRVVNFLIMHGIEKSRITFIGEGESKPLNSNTTEADKEFNRRVEFELE
jgi:outer membrane protein OmpA-like peptidoglycan-associated protein